MVFLVTLPVDELSRIDADLSITQRLTKALPLGLNPTSSGPRLAVVLSRDAHGSEVNSDRVHRAVVWMGVVLRLNTVGAVDKSITIDPLRKCAEAVPIDGPSGLLIDLTERHRAELENVLSSGEVSYCDSETWKALANALRARSSYLAQLLDWLTAQANPDVLSDQGVEERSWQEQQDAARTTLRLADFPLSAFAAWRRPTSRDAPYLAGLIPEPVEHSMIDHDARASIDDAGLFGAWRERSGLRCDIHVMHDSEGRRLEVANVNDTPVERRLGTDLIYYHERTHSFILVQYKRLDPRKRSLTVDKRLLSQMDRLEAVAKLSDVATKPHDWRLGSDSCFLKLAYWSENRRLSQELVRGMYLPLSYARLLLADECTRGKGSSRVFSAEAIERYLVSTQFIELVKHGLVGTVGTTVEQLRDFGIRRVTEGYSVVMAAERGKETLRQKQNRTNRHSSQKKGYVGRSYKQ